MIHARAACRPAAVLFDPGFEDLSIAALQAIAPDCPAKHVTFDRATLRVTEIRKDRWIESFRPHPDMVFLP